MSIPKMMPMKDCIGKRAMLDRDTMNGAGQVISAGVVVKIRSCGKSLNIETEKCPCCGQYCIIRGVLKRHLTLID